MFQVLASLFELI